MLPSSLKKRSVSKRIRKNGLKEITRGAGKVFLRLRACLQELKGLSLNPQHPCDHAHLGPRHQESRDRGIHRRGCWLPASLQALQETLPQRSKSDRELQGRTPGVHCWSLTYELMWTPCMHVHPTTTHTHLVFAMTILE